MSDIGKIIEAWERCKICNMSLLATPEGRKAYLDCEYTIGAYCNNDKLVNQTIDLLKELKEQQEPVGIEIEGGGSTWWYVCEDCHGAINDSDKYCRHCGRRLKRT